MDTSGTPNGPGAVRLPTTMSAHTGLRAVAATFVMLYHFTLSAGPAWHGVNLAFRHGYLGVDLFFVLSGFIIQHVYGRKLSGRLGAASCLTFLRYRIARIYPIHLATMLLALALSLLSSRLAHGGGWRPDFTVAGTLCSLVLIHGWFNTVAPNQVSWSVSAEWFAYLCYPALVVGLARARPLARLAFVALMMVVLTLWSGVNPILRVVPEFLLGLEAYALVPALRGRDAILVAVAALALASLVVVEAFVPGEQIALHAILFAALIVGLTSRGGFAVRALSTTPIVYLGEISYSLYLVHSLVRSLVDRAAAKASVDATTPPVVALSMLLAVAAAALAYHGIELPGRRLLRGPGAGAPQETTQLAERADRLSRKPVAG